MKATRADAPVLFLLASTLLIVGGRLAVPGHGLSWPGTYEAAAHIWVGFVLGLCFKPRLRTPAIICLFLASVLELACFLSR